MNTINKYSKLSILIMLLFAFSASLAIADNGRKKSLKDKFPKSYELPPHSNYFNDRIIVKFLPHMDEAVRFNTEAYARIAEIEKKWGVTSKTQRFKGIKKPEVAFSEGQPTVDLSLIYTFMVPAVTNLKELINELQATGMVQYACVEQYHQSTFRPNDPRYGFAPQTGDMRHFVRIGMEEAWDVTQGSSNVIIAIVDSGVLLSHEDLQSKIYVNIREIPNNGIDDDGNGKIDDIRGWDFAGSDFTAISDNGSHEDNNATVFGANNDHGIHVAGTAAAATNNGIGIPGAAPNCMILPVKCAADNDNRANGAGFIIGGYDGIAYAARTGAQVINCSWGGSGRDPFGEDAVNFATINNRSLVVVAAGNDNTNADFFPAAYDNVMNVASLNRDANSKSGFSNFGPRIDIAAPGSRILSTIFGNSSYGFKDGTSMASPLAAGIAALVKSQFPWMTALQLRAQLEGTATNIDAVNPRFVGQLGSGLINPVAALTNTTPIIDFEIATVATRDGRTLLVNGDTVLLDGDIINRLFPTTRQATARLIEDSPFIEIIGNNNINFGRLDFSERFDLAQPFQLVVSNNIPTNYNPNLIIEFTDSNNYVRRIPLNIALNTTFINVANNKLQATLTSNSRLGFADFNDTATGLGVRFNGENILFEGGLIVAIGRDTILDNLRDGTLNGTYKNVFQMTEPIKFDRESRFSTVYKAKFVAKDGNTSNNLLEIEQLGIVPLTVPDSNFVILHYRVKNLSNRTLRNVRLGMFNDWDLADNGANDRGAYTDNSKLGFTINNDNQSAAGTRIILNASDRREVIIHNIDPIRANGVNANNGFTDAEKFRTLTENVFSAGSQGAGTDVSQVISLPPFTLQPNGSDSISFAFGVAPSNFALRILMQQASTVLMNSIITNTKEDIALANTLSLYPNPARTAFKIAGLDNLEVNDISIQDISGKTIANYSPIDISNNNFSITNITKGLYLVKVSTTKGTAIKKIMVQ